MKRSIWLVLALLLMVFPSTGGASDALHVNTSIKPPFSTTEEDGFFDLLLKELGRRMDQDVKLVRLPPERALMSVNEGVSDAEMPRIAGIEKKYKNLVMVEEKVIDYKFVAFSRSKLGLDDWQALNDHSVGYLIGWKIFENNVPPEADVVKLRKPKLLFDMLDEGRIDVALYECYAGWAQIKGHGHTTIKECAEPLAVKPMYMYLHNSRAALAPVIARHLREMKSDGTYQRLAEQTLGTH